MGLSGYRVVIAATVLLTIVVILICLIPKAENDLFFELRTGADILSSGHVPHIDTYSWVNRGTRWDVPEWFAFVLFALAFKCAGFLGTWLVMVVVAVAAVYVVWFWLIRSVGLVWAFLLVNLMLLTMNDCIQERPYLFTYLLLPVSLIILTSVRNNTNFPRRKLLWLLPICALWANLHQGVVVLISIIFVYGLVDLIAWQRHAKRAGLMFCTVLGCIAASVISPYGLRLYWNIFITVRDHTLMSNVTEWNSVFTLPFEQLRPFILVTLIVLGSLFFSRRRDIGDCVVIAALFWQALLHARNMSLFAITSMIIIAPHFESSAAYLREHFHLPAERVTPSRLVTSFALFYVILIALVSFANLHRAVGIKRYSLQGIGEAVARVPSYPSAACAFMEKEKFPRNLRIYNNFEIGGYLIWRLPSEPVFIDGRLDVYVGKTFDDMLILTHGHDSPAWKALVSKYDFDCVITNSSRDAKTFGADSQWQLVYSDPPNKIHQHSRILLRRRPEFASLITRCLHSKPLMDLG